MFWILKKKLKKLERSKNCLQRLKRKSSQRLPDLSLGHGDAGRLVVVAPNLGHVDAVAEPAQKVLVRGQLLGFVEVLDEHDPYKLNVSHGE